MALTPWEPFEELTPLRDAMNRLWEESFIGPRRSPWPGFGGFGLLGRAFPVDVRETDAGYILEASMPGMKADAIQVTAMDNTVTIRATTKQEAKSEKAGTYVRHERYEGEVVRSITLPGPINREKIAATYEHGVLMLQVPKAEEAKGKVITVQVKEAPAAH
jgi:HSP20 family protein